MANFTFDPRTRRYRDASTGRFIPAKEVRQVVDVVIEAYWHDTIALLAQRLQTGQLTLAEWQVQTAQALKSLHVALAAAANGGFDNMSPADWGYVGSLVKRQYGFLRDFAADIASGKQLLNGSFLARVRLYCQAARGTYEQAVRRRERTAGMTEERRELGPADHCVTCVEEAAKGWQPIGTLRAIGDGLCRTNCHCEFNYRQVGSNQE